MQCIKNCISVVLS